MKIRRATLDDLPHIIAIYAMDVLTGYRENRSPEALEAYQHAFSKIDEDPNQLVLVAENEGAVVGTLQVTCIQHLISQSFKRAVIEAFFIDTTCQGKGIGALLIKAAEDWALEKGCVSLELTSNKKRKNAHRFYKKHHFTDSHEGFKKTI